MALDNSHSRLDGAGEIVDDDLVLAVLGQAGDNLAHVLKSVAAELLNFLLEEGGELPDEFGG